MGVKRMASFAPGDSMVLDPAPGLSKGPYHPELPGANRRAFTDHPQLRL